MTSINHKLEGEADSGFLMRLAGTHINPQTLLATDYMNHFNEPIMLIGMIGDMPDVIEDLRAWRFKTYPEHFLTSNLDYGPLAAEAYARAPAIYKDAFDNTTAQLARVITQSIAEIDLCLREGNMEKLRRRAAASARATTALADAAGAIIAGELQRIAQEDIDKLFGSGTPDG